MHACSLTTAQLPFTAMSRYQEGEAAASCVPATEAAREVLARAAEAMGFQGQCGLSRASQTKCQYTHDGRLWETNKYGVYEVMP